MTNDGSYSVRPGKNDVVLAQRAAFLRDDSVLAILMLTGYGSIANTVEAMRLGATTYAAMLDDRVTVWDAANGDVVATAPVAAESTSNEGAAQRDVAILATAVLPAPASTLVSGVGGTVPRSTRLGSIQPDVLTRVIPTGDRRD